MLNYSDIDVLSHQPTPILRELAKIQLPPDYSIIDRWGDELDLRFMPQISEEWGDLRELVRWAQEVMDYCDAGISDFILTGFLPAPVYHWQLGSFLVSKGILEAPSTGNPKMDNLLMNEWQCLDQTFKRTLAEDRLYEDLLLEGEWYFPIELLIWGAKELCRS